MVDATVEQSGGWYTIVKLTNVCLFQKFGLNYCRIEVRSREHYSDSAELTVLSNVSDGHSL
jgi:hypothetical protein